MSKPLKQFYAVSQTSLYVAISEGEFEKAPILMKLDETPGAVSKASVAVRHVGWDSPFFRIRGHFLQLCCGWDDSHHEEYSMSPLVALFLDENEARRCLMMENTEILDGRWRKQTLEVLRSIGDDHPVFNVWWDEFPPDYISSV